ncbi:hypothetical protein GCM10011533_36720 [Streptosporangium jomthongense]|uniref:MarR family transcriptional regulator n=1 Tax=Marinobacter aromaticivorans TaxID=1494078 RepID=A0ABW2J0T2_9GAMM|nr:hypothetical protein [Marinobacter aromaticivorans]GGE80996.1 hypothetical protein GCM10011533_36720 [Streptosporangium jomthongense]
MTEDEKDTGKPDKENSTDKGQGSSSASGPMEMGMGMAKKMMGQMGKGGPSPMAMMQKMMAQMGQGQEGGAQMPPMMQMCMGMCSEMLTAIKRTTDMAAFATPELQNLFTEWLETLEEEALRHLEEGGETDVAGLAKALNISEESTVYLVAHMTNSGKVLSKVQAIGEGKKQ